MVARSVSGFMRPDAPAVATVMNLSVL